MRKTEKDKGREILKREKASGPWRHQLRSPPEQLTSKNEKERRKKKERRKRRE